MTTAQQTNFIARRAAKGYNADESRAILTDLTRRHTGHNLVTALVYCGFATKRQAEKVA